MNDNPLGEIVYRYTRAQAIADGWQVEVTKTGRGGTHLQRRRAIADGWQVEVTKTAAEAGISVPVFITRKAFDTFVTGPDKTGQLRDIIGRLRVALAKANPGQTRLPFGFLARFDDQYPRRVNLLATCGPLDLDDPRPAITLMMVEED